MSMKPSTYWVLMSLAAGRRHGYAVMRDVSELSDGTAAVQAATLYPTLDRLTREGLIAADGEEIVGGRVRRYYRLSETGAELLRAEAAHLAARARRTAAHLAATGWSEASPVGGAA